MNLAGLPAQISLGGMDFVTTEPAPTMEFSPIVTPFRMMECAPINTLSSICTGAHLRCVISSLLALTPASSEWKSVVYMQVPPPHFNILSDFNATV